MSAASASTQALGMVLTLVSVVYSAFRAGSNTQTFAAGDWAAEAGQPLVPARGEEGEQPDGAPGAQAMERGSGGSGGGAAPGAALSEFEPPSYSYAQFHAIFALASLYVAMLMTGWGSAAGGASVAPRGLASRAGQRRGDGGLPAGARAACPPT